MYGFDLPPFTLYKIHFKPCCLNKNHSILFYKSLDILKVINYFTTFSDGCLGSRNDEERSEMRYVMRIAQLVNHQTLERILRFRDIPGSILV